MLWMQAIALVVIFVLANLIYKDNNGMMLVAANPVISLGGAALLLLTGIALWKMKKWGVFLFALVGALVIFGSIKPMRVFPYAGTGISTISLLTGIIFSYLCMVFELWREIAR